MLWASLSVRLSVCHTLVSLDRISKSSISWLILRHSPIDSENWIGNPPYLGNRVRYEEITILLTQWKSHTGFPFVPKLVTLNNLERRNSCYFALFHRIRHRGWSYYTHTVCNVECSPKNLLSRNLWFTAIFSEVTEKTCVNERHPHTRQLKVALHNNARPLWSTAEFLLDLAQGA